MRLDDSWQQWNGLCLAWEQLWSVPDAMHEVSSSPEQFYWRKTWASSLPLDPCVSETQEEYIVITCCSAWLYVLQNHIKFCYLKWVRWYRQFPAAKLSPLVTEAYWGHSIYEYIFSISGKICVISISEKIFFWILKKNNFVFWKNIILNLRKM